MVEITQKTLSILHFNDVYNIEENPSSYGKLRGGAARFKTAWNEHGSKEKLCLFSGDLFSPSMLSFNFDGEQMVGVFNQLQIHVSCLGNHDLDFGVLRMNELVSQTAPTSWLMSNMSLN